MIILHSPFDKASRDFVEAYGEGHTVLEYPECVNQFPNISAFPSVVIEVPAYKTEDTVGENEEFSPGINIPNYTELLRCPANWQEVEDYISMVNQRAIDSPPV